MQITEIEISMCNSDYSRCMYLMHCVRYFETLAITFGAQKYIFNNDCGGYGTRYSRLCDSRCDIRCTTSWSLSRSEITILEIWKWRESQIHYSYHICNTTCSTTYIWFIYTWHYIYICGDNRTSIASSMHVGGKTAWWGRWEPRSASGA